MTYLLLFELSYLGKALGESLLLAKNEWLALLLLSDLASLSSDVVLRISSDLLLKDLDIKIGT